MSATRQEGAHGVPTLTILLSNEVENMRSASGKRAKSCAAKTFLRKGQLNRKTRFGSALHTWVGAAIVTRSNSHSRRGKEVTTETLISVGSFGDTEERMSVWIFALRAPSPCVIDRIQKESFMMEDFSIPETSDGGSYPWQRVGRFEIRLSWKSCGRRSSRSTFNFLFNTTLTPPPPRPPPPSPQNPPSRPEPPSPAPHSSQPNVRNSTPCTVTITKERHCHRR